MKVAKVLDLHDELIPVSIHGKQAERLVRGILSQTRLKSSFHIVEISNSGSKSTAPETGLCASLGMLPEAESLLLRFHE